MSNYLVTGGAGFIGSALSRKLLSLGHKVFIIDNLSTGKMENVPPDATFLLGSVFGEEVWQFENIKFEAIFHIAGQSSGEISFSDPIYDIQTNAESTLNLLKFALANGCKNFIFASTMSVYGAVEDKAISESHMTTPLSFYGVGKLASEHYLRIYSQNYDIKTSALRLFNVYGPGQNLDNMKQGMISIFMTYLLKSEPIHVKGSGDRFRDFVYVDDVVNAFIKQLDHMQAFNIVNIATGKKTCIKDLLIALIKACGMAPVNYPYFFEGSTPGDQFGIFADISQAKKTIDWTPQIDLETGLKRMADWARGNLKS